MIHQGLERFDGSWVAREERDRKGTPQRVDRCLNAGALGHALDRLPDDLVGALHAADAGRPAIRDHVVVSATRHLVRLLRLHEDRPEVMRHRLRRDLRALLTKPQRPLFEINITPAKLTR